MAKITYANKVDRRTNNIPEIYKITPGNMNEIKASVNSIYDALANAVIPISFTITASDFDGNSYFNSLLVNKTAMTDFYIQANNGSGTLLSVNNGFTFNSNTGTLRMEQGNYFITIYKKIL